MGKSHQKQKMTYFMLLTMQQDFSVVFKILKWHYLYVTACELKSVLISADEFIVCLCTVFLCKMWNKQTSLHL